MSISVSETEKLNVKKVNNEAKGSFWWKDKFRFFMMIICLFCLTSVSANVAVFNQAVVCMNGGTKQRRVSNVL